MTRTTENLLTWAPLGAGLALVLSDHKRLGVAVAAVSPATVAWRHPRATRRALTGFGRQISRGAARSAKKTAKSVRWLAS